MDGRTDGRGQGTTLSAVSYAGPYNNFISVKAYEMTIQLKLQKIILGLFWASE